jgi:hypothetical protein
MYLTMSFKYAAINSLVSAYQIHRSVLLLHGQQLFVVEM